MRAPLENITLFEEGKDAFSLVRLPFSKSEEYLAGSCFLWLEDGTTHLLSTIAMMDLSRPLRVRSPIGIREISVYKGPFYDVARSASLNAVKVGSYYGKFVNLDTDCDSIFISREQNTIQSIPLAKGTFLGVSSDNTAQYNVTFADYVMRKYPHYVYFVTPGPIYVGFSSSRIFLPMMLR